MLLSKIVLPLMVLVFKKIIAEEVDLHFQQHDYHLELVRCEMVRYNKSILKEISYKTFKYNRTIAVVNVTFTFKLDIYNLEVVAQAYKFVSNEYRFFPIHFGFSGCKAIAVDAGGVKTAIEKCGNYHGCPMMKGINYYICNMYPDPSKLPPYIPNGEYKIEVQMLFFSQEVVTINLYAAVTRPFEWWKSNVTEKPLHHL